MNFIGDDWAESITMMCILWTRPGGGSPLAGRPRDYAAPRAHELVVGRPGTGTGGDRD